MTEPLTNQVPTDGLEAYQQGYTMYDNPFSEQDEWAAWMTWGCGWCKGRLFDGQVEAEYGQE